MANDPITLDMSTSQPLNPAPVTLDMSTSQPLDAAPASQPGAYQVTKGGPIRNVNPPADTDTSKWPHVKFSSGAVHQIHPEDLSEALRRNPGAMAVEDTGVVAGLKRIPDTITGLYHAFAAPATDQEKAALLAKIREQNAKGDSIPEELATNPSRATLALHRLVDAPADELELKGHNERAVAKDLLSRGKIAEGVSRYISGLTDAGLSAVPLAGPMVENIANRGERGDFSGAATDVASAWALENAGGLTRLGGKAVGKVAEAAGQIPGKVKNTAEAIKPEWLTKRPEAPAPQHGTPVRVESPLDGPTVGKQIGGKDLSQEALDTLKGHVGDKIPVGSTAKNMITKAVEPVSKAISETASKMNAVVQKAPPLTTSVMQDSVFGEGGLTAEIEGIKKNLPPSVKKNLREDVDAIMEDADKALNSNNPTEVLEQRRLLGNQIDWDKIEKNPSTPAEVQNLARVKIYKALGDKIHAEIPETVELDKTLQPNIELRSHIISKTSERFRTDPHAATVEHQSELKKGQTAVENTAHNEQVAKNWNKVKIAAGVAGVTGLDKLWKLFESAKP